MYFIQILPLGAMLFRVDRQTDTEMTKLIVAFSNLRTLLEIIISCPFKGPFHLRMRM